MHHPTLTVNRTAWSRLKLYFALSRTPHGLLDMCTPAMGALIWLGGFPPAPVVLLGMMTAFAGYTAVYALNDVVDYRADRERVRRGELPSSESYLDDVLVRHPMAYGLVSFRAGAGWALAWSILAMAGAYLLNPVCVFIFLAGCLLEAVYCFLFTVSPLRTFVSGVVKTSGGIAAVFAVDPDPSPFFLLTLFVMLLCWEIGGQNIPHDWEAIDKDRCLAAKTIPLQWGAKKATHLVLVTITVACAANLALLFFSRGNFGMTAFAGAVLINGYLLVLPSLRLKRTQNRATAMALFNRASYYPFALLLLAVVDILMRLNT